MAANVFPNYGVVRLGDVPQTIKKRSILTQEIEDVQALVESFAAAFVDAAKQSYPLLISVKGDYGTGKTHLMLHAIATLQERTRQATVARLVAPEAGPSGWLGIEPGPTTAIPFKELVLAVFQEAALSVARDSRLTQKEAQQVAADPWSVRQLIEDGELNASVVDHDFRERMKRICEPEMSSDVQHALAALTDQTLAEHAQAWLSGKELGEAERDALQIAKAKAEAQEVLAIFVAAAALHNWARRPFALIVDEWEHAFDWDRKHSNSEVQEWLKRLLEALSRFSPLVIVAGHSRAWEGQANLLERFTQHISMAIWSPEWIEHWIAAISGHSLTNFGPQARAIQEATGGRIRDVLTLCSMLWDESDGFTRPLDPERIRSRTSLVSERAIDEIQGLLQELSYTVQRPGAIGNGVPFELVGFKAGAPGVVFDFRHSRTQQHPRDKFVKFLEKVRDTATIYPNLLPCFVAEGNTDPDLRAIAEASRPEAPTSSVARRVRYFDTKTPNVLTQIRQALLALATPEAGAQVSPAEAILAQARIIDRRLADATVSNDDPTLEKLRAERIAVDQRLEQIQKSMAKRDADLEKRLQELEAQRAREYAALQERVVASAPDSAVGASLAAALVEDPDRVDTTYRAISAEYSPMRALGIVVGSSPFIVSALMAVAGVALWYFASDFVLVTFGLPTADGVALTNKELYEIVQAHRLTIVARFVGAALMLVGMFGVLREAVFVQRFLEHARRLLRELYIRTRSAQDLSRADSMLQEVLVIHGPRRGMLIAREVLAKAFPFFDTSRIRAEK
jgi:Cdc6-like AAA superfamily ATPase